MSEWIKCSEQMPKPGQIVLAFYLNPMRLPRRIRAMHAPEDTLEAEAYGDEEGEGYFLPAGWWEASENCDPNYMLIDEAPTHWMPLPDPPKENPQSPSGQA